MKVSGKLCQRLSTLVARLPLAIILTARESESGRERRVKWVAKFFGGGREEGRRRTWLIPHRHPSLKRVNKGHTNPSTRGALAIQ